MTEERERELYLDYFNNFLTVERFADYYGLSIDGATDLINKQRSFDYVA